MQPILQVSADDLQSSDYHVDSGYLQQRLIDECIGLPVRQFAGRVHAIANLKEKIEFDPIVGSDCRPLYDLLAQVYEHQNEIQTRYQVFSQDMVRLRRFNRLVKLLMRANTATANYLRLHPPVPA